MPRKNKPPKGPSRRYILICKRCGKTFESLYHKSRVCVTCVHEGLADLGNQNIF